MKKSIVSLILVFGVVSLLHAEFVRDNSKEVVVDKSTNLMWQDDNDVKSITKTWVEAINYCENLTLGGYTDWRLPNINELKSIVDYTKAEPAISSEFSNVALVATVAMLGLSPPTTAVTTATVSLTRTMFVACETIIDTLSFCSPRFSWGC